MATRAKPTEPGPIPDEWISENPDPDASAEWWARWRKLPPIERPRPAAEALAEVRGEEPYDFDDE